MIPWAAILRHAPAILAAADALRARARTSSGEDKGRGIEARLSSLEQGSRESAQLLQDIAQQIQALAVAQGSPFDEPALLSALPSLLELLRSARVFSRSCGRRLSNVEVPVPKAVSPRSSRCLARRLSRSPRRCTRSAPQLTLGLQPII
jgi:hypothetical protein